MNDMNEPTSKRQKSALWTRGRRGVALIMVLFTVTILTVVAVEFQYESRVYLQTTANFRDRLRAQYLGRSAVQMTRLVLYLQKTVDQMIKQFFKNNPPNIQLWQLIPIDSDLMRAVVGGFFEAQEQQAKQEAAKQEAAQQGHGDSQGKSSDKLHDATKTVASAGAGQGEGFGEFDGHFHADIIDEESKINVNVRSSNAKEVATFKAQLERLFAPTTYDPLFENPDSHGQYHDRQEIIYAILDWIDPDNQRSGFDSGDESSRYDYLEDKYASKNHFFDSLDEMQLVSGIDDRFWRLFGESFTVYRTGKINVNTCGPEVMRALLEQYLTQPLPQDAEMQRILDVVMDFRVQNSGFYNETAFANFLTLGPELTLELQNGAAGRQALIQAVTVSSGIFTVKAQGDVNGVMQTIKVVMTKSGDLLYYRVE